MSIHLRKDETVSSAALTTSESAVIALEHKRAVHRAKAIAITSTHGLILVGLVAAGVEALQWFLPSLPGTISHVWHNVYAISQTHSLGRAQNLGDVAFGVTTAVVALLSGVAVGLARQTAVPVVVSALIAVSLFFGPRIIDGVLHGTEPISHNIQHERLLTGYAPEVIQASKLDVLSRKKKLSFIERTDLAVDIDWMVQHPDFVKVGKHGYAPFSSKNRAKILYRFAAPLPADERPAIVQKYVQRITAERKQGEAVDREILLFDFAVGTVLIGWKFFETKWKQNLVFVSKIIGSECTFKKNTKKADFAVAVNAYPMALLSDFGKSEKHGHEPFSENIHSSDQWKI